MNRVRTMAAWAAMAAAAAGCGGGGPDPGPQGTAEGSVRYDGKPLDNGVVRFAPAAGGKGTEAMVRDGKYAAPKVTPGKVKASVQGFKGAAGSTGEPLFQETAPGASKDVDVSAGPQVIDFDVKPEK